VQIAGKSGNHAGSPALLALTPIDQAADFPVKADQLGIHCQNGPGLRLTHPLANVSQQGGVVGRQGGDVRHGQRGCLTKPMPANISRVIKRCLD
jgi:hypothetical protein